MTTTTPKQLYLERMIRGGYTAADVNMWTGLLRSAEIEETLSVTHLHALLDLANHLKCSHLDLIKMGRDMLPKAKKIDDEFLKAIWSMLDHDAYEEYKEEHVPGYVDEDVVKINKKPGGNGDSGTVNKPAKPIVKVLDLTCDDESLSSSHSYEEESNEYNSNPTSAEAYDIDDDVPPQGQLSQIRAYENRRGLKRRVEIFSQ